MIIKIESNRKMQQSTFSKLSDIAEKEGFLKVVMVQVYKSSIKKGLINF